ncbi:Ysc84 domain-containing protein [Fusarium falciforme]|uniref:Ysc84 domain-containing protein n=1 Tax=Fusarium falciforme TaxID=195108 RepID=UPI0023016E62|nr:Ysc84 domain-containing protein [Fusarium falciforme]WAO94347.1 Ysc84 domain-containing protein [Fusarium falciforme]
MGFFKAADIRHECDKAAQILKSFVEKSKIPSEVIAGAQGLAIFTGFRAGMYLAGAGGSGIVVARLPDGTWSPPSAFSVRSGSIGLVYGLDVYDCVCVLNTQAAVGAYKTSEMSLGGAVALAAGPIGGTANVKEIKPVWTYTKSRGFYGGLTVDGTVIEERRDASADFYGSSVSSKQILEGDVEIVHGSHDWRAGAKQLIEVLKTAEGKQGDAKILQEISDQPTPGDLRE